MPVPCKCKKFNFEKMRSECFKEVKQQNGGKQIMFSSDLKNDIDQYMIESHMKMHLNKKITKNTAEQHYNALSKLLTTKMNKLFSMKAGGKITGGDASKIL